MTEFEQYATNGDVCLNGNEDYKVRSLTIFPDLSTAAGFNPMGTFGNSVSANSFPLPNSWDFIDDFAWTTVQDGYNLVTGKYKNRPIAPVVYKEIFAFAPNPGPTESIVEYAEDPITGEIVSTLLGHYDYDINGQLVEILDETDGTLISWGGDYYDQVAGWTESDYDSIGDPNRISDAFNGFDDELYYKIRSRHRNTLACDKKYLGVDATACESNPNTPSVDALLVSKNEAPMFVFRLRPHPQGDNCLYWTMQVAEGACKDYYLDLNPVGSFDAKFTKEPVHEGI